MNPGFPRTSVLLALALACVPAILHAQGYPAKPIRVVIGFSAGSEIDTIGRLVSQKLSETLGQQLVVENRTGAGGSLAAGVVAGATGIQVTHVPYKGVPEVLADTMTGRINTSFAPIGNVLGMIKDGRLVPLAVSTAARSPSLPEVPALAESAAPGLDWDQWYGKFAPAGTPRPLVHQLSKEVARVLAQAEMRERLAGRGSVPKASTPEAFDAFVRAEVAKVSRVVREGNIRIG